MENPEDRAATPPASGDGSAGVRIRREVRVKKKKSRRSPLRKFRHAIEGLTPEAAERGIDLLIQVLLIAMILLAPLPLGSVAPWARSILSVWTGLLLFLWVLKSALAGRLEIMQIRVWGLLLVYLLILCFQLVPLSDPVLSVLSPKAAELYSRLIPGYPDASGPMPLSLNPHATTLEICRIATFFILFFVLVNQLRERWQVNSLLWALVALGLFQSLYGLGERFSGNPHIFWVAPPDRVSVHGTYYNRNHFAGLMEMLTPAVFGFLMTFLARQRRSSWRASRLSLLSRLSESLSKSRIYRNLLLGMLVASMFVAAVLSLSRSGILGLLIAFFILFVFATQGGSESQPRTNRLPIVILAVLLLAVGLLFYQGLGTVIDRFEQLTEDSSSWSGRAALREAGLRMIRDFPALGAGGGTFGDVFPAYQPLQYGDRLAQYLHNDWLQVICETGLAGALTLYAALAILFVRLVRRIRRRADSYCRFVFAGAFAGIAAMLAHSLFDFNLYMVTANGLIFVVLAAICHAAAYMRGRRKDSTEGFSILAIPILRPALRMLLPGLALALLAAAAVVPIRMGLANVSFSRYLTWAEGKPDHYYFWRPRAAESADLAKEHLDRASRLDPGAAEYAFHQGLFRVRRIDENVQGLAREIARGILLKDYSFNPQDPVQSLAQQITREVTRQDLQVDEESPEFKALISAFELPAKRRLQETIRTELGQAEEHFRKAIRIAPTLPWHHMDLARSLLNNLVPGPDLDREKPRMNKLVEDALFLAPFRPATLYHTGWYYVMESLHFPGGMSETEIGARQQEALAMLKQAVEGEPIRYDYPVYSLVLNEVRAEPQVLLGLTPGTLPSQARLFRYLQSNRLWPTALEATGNVLRLLGVDPESDQVPPALAPDLPEFRIAEQFSRARLELLRRLGLAEQAGTEDGRYRNLVGARCRHLVGEASRFTRLGRFTEARKACKDCLDLDWNNLDALLGRTEILVRPGMDRTGELKSGTLDDFMRALNPSPRLAPDQCERVSRILSDPGLTPATPPEHLKHQFVESLRALSCGGPLEAAQSLQAMLLVHVPTFVFWHQRHLIHYQLGRSLEASGRSEEAIQEYARTVALAPSHRDSLARLAALGAEEPSSNIAERLQELTPEVPWGIGFSGKIRLLGTSLTVVGGVEPSPSTLPSGGEGIGMAEAPEGAANEKSPSGKENSGLAPASGAFVARYYWMVEDDLDPAGFDVSYRYFNAEGNLLFVDRKPLGPPLQEPTQSLDGGIGSVFVHEHPVPFPPQIAREVEFQVRKLPKGKIPAEVLKSVTGSTWVTLGLLTPHVR